MVQPQRRTQTDQSAAQSPTMMLIRDLISIDNSTYLALDKPQPLEVARDVLWAHNVCRRTYMCHATYLANQHGVLGDDSPHARHHRLQRLTVLPQHLSRYTRQWRQKADNRLHRYGMIMYARDRCQRQNVTSADMKDKI